MEELDTLPSLEGIYTIIAIAQVKIITENSMPKRKEDRVHGSHHLIIEQSSSKIHCKWQVIRFIIPETRQLVN